jgi:hypothetical protein
VKLLRTLERGKGTTSRRQLLKALGVSAAAAPLLPALDGWAAGTGPIKRLLLLFTPDGIVDEQWYPTGSETQWAFPDGRDHGRHEPPQERPDLRQGLAPQDLGERRARAGHGRAVDRLRPPRQQAAQRPLRRSDHRQAAAQGDRLPSLQFGAMSFFGGPGVAYRYESVNSYMIYSAADAAIPAEQDPYKLFDRVFAGVATGGVGDTMAMDKIRAERKSILDFVKDELADVQTKVGREDRAKIDNHLEATLEIERRLQNVGTKPVGMVDKPAPGIDISKNDSYPQVIPLMNKLLVSTLAADRTRVASMQYSRGFSKHTHSWIGAKTDHHTLSHMTAQKPILAAIQKWYMGHLADLLDALKAVQENGKPMLDNMLVVYANEVHTGWNHDPGPVPAWWAGHLGGTVPRTNRFLDLGGGQYDWNQMLATMAQAMGVNVDKVGNMGAAGKIPGLLA